LKAVVTMIALKISCLMLEIILPTMTRSEVLKYTTHGGK